MKPANYISTHSIAPSLEEPVGMVNTALLNDAYRAMLRLAKNTNLPQLREIAYQEDHESSFRFANAGKEVFVTLNDDQYISRALAMYGMFDFETFERAAAVLSRPISTFFDVGANLGSIFIPVVARGYAEKAVAFEPDALNFRVMMANIFLNNLQDKVIAINSALGAEAEEVLEFELSPTNKGDHRVRLLTEDGAFGEKSWATTQVNSTSLDTIVAAKKLEDDLEESLLWIDVQGWEPKVLAGSSKILARAVPVVIELWPYALHRNGVFNDLVEIICTNFEKIYVVSHPEILEYPATPAGLEKIIGILNPEAPLSACDILMI